MIKNQDVVVCLKDKNMVITEYGDCIFEEDEIITLLYQNPKLDFSRFYVNEIAKYTSALKELDLDLPAINNIPKRVNLKEFDEKNCEQWHIPESYAGIDVKAYLLERCGTEAERERVEAEYQLFEAKKFTKVLQFLIYFVDTLRANNVVWGVGRGSSVSSFCLFLIGVHKINPLLYDLDYREFLR